MCARGARKEVVETSDGAADDVGSEWRTWPQAWRTSTSNRLDISCKSPVPTSSVDKKTPVFDIPSVSHTMDRVIGSRRPE